MKSRVPFLIAASLLCCIPAALAEYPLLSSPAYHPGKPAEGIIIEMKEDGSFLTDSGNTHKADGIIGICRDWRKDGAEPAIRIILHPAIPSNKDLTNLLPLIEALHREKIGFDIQLAPVEPKPASLPSTPPAR